MYYIVIFLNLFIYLFFLQHWSI